jgi:hypothetical protein
MLHTCMAGMNHDHEVAPSVSRSDAVRSIVAVTSRYELSPKHVEELLLPRRRSSPAERKEGVRLR